AHALDEIARSWTPDADAAPAGGQILQMDPGIIRHLATHPGQVVHPDAAPGDHPETLVLDPGDRQVGHDAAAFIEHCGVGHLADRVVHLVCRDPLQIGKRPWPRHLDLLKGGRVEEHHPLARRPMLEGLDWRPEHGRPSTPLRDRAMRVSLPPRGGGSGWGPIALVPLWPLPARPLEEHRAQRLLAVVEGRQTEFARRFHRLEWVDDVVHLAVVLGTTGA